MYINKAKRIVIKIGSSIIAGDDGEGIRLNWLKHLAEDIYKLKKDKKEIIIVSSGAVALGKKYICKNKKYLKLEEKQASAACGQTELVDSYKKLLAKHDVNVAQILLTIQDSENRRRYLNARNTINTLLNAGIMPIINENDTVATSELRFGDNDRLAARVAQMVGADLLILLSDVDGLYTANPRLDNGASHIPVVENITDKIKKMASSALSEVGSGGMITKISAAEIATDNGCNMIITNGKVDSPISAIQNGALYTIFLSHENPVSARKRWIANKLNINGDIIIDSGAKNALLSGKSLLPAGILDIKGTFKRGDVVAVRDHKMEEVARGLVEYSSKDARLLMGQHSKNIANIVGFIGREEMIHRDDLVIMIKKQGVK